MILYEFFEKWHYFSLELAVYYTSCKFISNAWWIMA